MTEDDDGEERALGRFSAGRASAAERARKMRLLRRIADALQAPDFTLGSEPNLAVRSGPEPSANEGDLDGECVALLDAYRRIRDPDMRRRLLIVVLEVAEPR